MQDTFFRAKTRNRIKNEQAMILSSNSVVIINNRPNENRQKAGFKRELFKFKIFLAKRKVFVF